MADLSGIFRGICLRGQKRAICSAAAVLGTQFVLTGTSLQPARAADPSHEQCTCDIPGNAQRTGAQVVNAGSCVLEARYPWCDIFLATTENSAAQSTLVGTLRSNSPNPEKLRSILLPLFDQFVNSSAQTSPELTKVRRSDAETIKALIDKSYQELSICVQNFDKGEAVSQENAATRCDVGPVSKWLKIIFLVNSRTYIFLFSPNA
jgi:hypothetical protein